MQPGADHAVHRGYIVPGGDFAGADGPDRLVGNGDGVTGEGLRQACGKLPPHHRFGLPGFALFKGLAHAEDHADPRLHAGGNLGQHLRVGFAVVGATLRVTNDNPTRTQIDQHSRRHVAGMGAVGVGRAVLSPDKNRAVGDFFEHSRQVRGRGEQRGCGRACGQLLGQRSGQRTRLIQRSVHLPVASNKHGSGLPSFRELLLRLV